MAERVKVWFDPEVNFLEVIFSNAPSYMRETKNDAVVERVDWDGKRRDFGVTAYLKLEQGKIWIEEDWTKHIANDLLKAVAPAEHIVLGFQHPSTCLLTEFAIA